MITQPGNLDNLIDFVYFRLGDFNKENTTITTIRTSLVASVRFLANRWNHKYLIWDADTRVSPQPEYIQSGYVYVNTKSGYATILDNSGDGTPYAVNDVYRNPHVAFDQSEGIVVDSDKDAIILAAAYLVQLAKMTNSSDTFVSWKTEDISYSNLGAERSKTMILETLRKELEELLKKGLGKAKISEFNSWRLYERS
jgi:hypothetical protein